MNFEKRLAKKHISCFKKLHKKIKKHLKSYITDSRADLEIFSALIVIFDFAITTAGQDRIPFLKNILPLEKSFKPVKGFVLQDRIDFYSEFICDKQPRCDFCPVVSNIDNPILRVIIALGDIIHNPTLICDYDNEAILVDDIFSNIEYTTILKNLVTKEIVLTFNYVIDINSNN